MQPGTRTESEVDVRQSVTIEVDPPTPALREDSGPKPEPVVPEPVVPEPDVAEPDVAESTPDLFDEDPEVGDAGSGPDDYLLGTPAGGRAVTGGLVVGVAAAVGIVMVSVVAMLITALAGTVIAYAVAHDDEWIRSARRRRARRGQVLVAPRWTRHSWGAGHGMGRHAA